ncbi:MAG: hypothetical protein ACJZ7Z_11305 [Myxococcota bacterium]
MMEKADSSPRESYSLGTSLRSASHYARERLRSFRTIYIAVFVFILLYITTVRVFEYALDEHFQSLANSAINITNLDRPVALQIQQNMEASILRSSWIRWGGVKVDSLVLGSDGITWIYVQGQIEPQNEGLRPTDVLKQAVALLPASAAVTVTVPHNSLLANGILIAYASALLWGLYLNNRSNQRRYTRELDSALESRDETAHRVGEIEKELKITRERLVNVEPSEKAMAQEISVLNHERQELQRKLAGLTAREEELRGKADEAMSLTQEVRALEDLLEEAASDIETKDNEITGLEKNLKSATKATGSSGKSKASETLARRLRTLYKNLEVDDHALETMVALRDETMKLKAEEVLKRLGEEADNVTVRRKVGGLPNHLNIFEMGFAGKGRIYYARGKQRQFRILAIGAKNSQDSDMEYLRRLSREDMG